MIRLTLPWPPSTNSVWRNVHGRTLLSRKGRQFRKDVATAVAGQHHAPECPCVDAFSEGRIPEQETDQ